MGIISGAGKQGVAARPSARFGADSAAERLSGSVERLKILLVGSGGGHWVQLMRVAPAFAEHECVFVTTVQGCEPDIGNAGLHVVTDANRWERFKALRLAVKMLLIVLRERPDVVVSTGAAPGYFALRFGKMVGARTVWLDSIANIEKLSMSGQMVSRFADLWLTQWPHLSRPDGPHYEGSVL